MRSRIAVFFPVNIREVSEKCACLEIDLAASAATCENIRLITRTQSRIALRADRVPVFATVLFAEFFLVGDFIAKDGYYK